MSDNFNFKPISGIGNNPESVELLFKLLKFKLYLTKLIPMIGDISKASFLNIFSI
jgi:hypothetical protein